MYIVSAGADVAGDTTPLPTPLIWLTPDNIVTDGNNLVNGWTNNGSLQVTFSQDDRDLRPELKADNGNPCLKAVHFRGKQFLECQSLPDLDSSELTVFSVFQAEDTRACQCLIGSSYAKGAVNHNQYFWGVYLFRNKINAFSRTKSGMMKKVTHHLDHTPTIHCMKWDGKGELSAWKNNFRKGPVAHVSGRPEGHIRTRIGASSKEESGFFRGNIHEIMIYNRPLTKEQIYEVYKYLKNKYFPDSERPMIHSIAALGDPRQITVTFSEPVDRSEAENLENYQVLQDDIHVIKAELRDDHCNVVLTVDKDLCLGRTYVLKCSGPCDEAGNQIDPDALNCFEYYNLPNEQLAIWLKGDGSFQLDEEQRIISWLDSSEKKHNVCFYRQPDKRPLIKTHALNEKPAVKFNGKNAILTGSIESLETDTISWFIMFRTEPGKGKVKQYIIGNAYRKGARRRSRDMWGSMIFNRKIYGFTHAFDGKPKSVQHEIDDEWHIHSVIWDENDNLSGFLDGRELNTIAGADAVPEKHARLTVGADPKRLRQNFTGEIAEILVYSKALNKKERRQVELYLRHKYYPELDSDKDGLPDEWEMIYFANLDQGAGQDYDRDELSNLDEYLLETDPTNADSDKDGVTDGWENENGSDPLDPDSLPVYTVRFISGKNGALIGRKIQQVKHGGTSETMTAVAHSGYKFDSWTGDYVGTQNPLTLSRVTGNMSVTATFKPAQDGKSIVLSDYILKVLEGKSVSCEASLSCKPEKDITLSIACVNATCDIALKTGKTLTFNADNWNVPQEIRFEALNDNKHTWGGNAEFILLADEYGSRQIYISMTENDVQVSVASDDLNTGNVSPSGNLSVESGASLTVTALPKPGYLFRKWKGTVPKEKETENPLTITADQQISLTALFSEDPAKTRVVVEVDDMVGGWHQVYTASDGGWASDFSCEYSGFSKPAYVDDIRISQSGKLMFAEGFETQSVNSSPGNWQCSDSGLTGSTTDAETYSGKHAFQIRNAGNGQERFMIPATRTKGESVLSFCVCLPKIENLETKIAFWLNGVPLEFIPSSQLAYQLFVGGRPPQDEPMTVIPCLTAEYWHVVKLHFDSYIDTDLDGMDDQWEKDNFGDLSQNADGDSDDDGVSNIEEYMNPSDPNRRNITVSFAAVSSTVNENDEKTEVKLKLSEKCDEPVKVEVFVSSSTAEMGKDYNVQSPQMITFNPGETERSFSVDIIKDSAFGEAKEYVIFKIARTLNVDCGSPAQYVLYISDSEGEDSDKDGLPDWWEMKYFNNLEQNAADDPDQDGATNLQEYKQGRHPQAGVKYVDAKTVGLKLFIPGLTLEERK